MQYLTKQTFKIFWQHLWHYKWSVLVIFFGVIGGSITNIIAPLFYKQFFDVLVNSAGARESSVLVAILGKIFLVYFLGWLCYRLISFFMSYFQTNAMADLENTSFGYLHKHSVSFFNNNFVGSLVKKVNRFSHSFEMITDMLVWDLLPMVVITVSVIFVLTKKNIFIGLGILAWVIVYILINYFFSIYKLKYDTQRAALSSKVTGVLADTISNHSNVKLFNGYTREKKLFAQVNSEFQKIHQFAWNLGNYFETGQAMFMILLEIGVMYYAVLLWQKNILTVGDFVLLQSYLLNIIMRLWSFGRLVRKYYENMANAEEMTEIFTTEHEIKDVKNAKTLKITKGEIDWQEVNFNYNQTRQIIKDFTLKIKAKEKIAFIGPSGAGKSTLVNLLLRNYDLASGKILIDGQKIDKITQESLWQNISFVNQDPILFHRTLEENIAYGKPGASMAEIIKAAKLAYADDFINSFSEKYQTFVGERGVRLSGGERQRVAIARAILKNASILVLDEATSSLDSESEELIQAALANLMKNKTVIVIAHRLSTIMKMDRIVVLNQGQIVEQGTHQELTNKNGGLYKKLWEKQVGGFIK
ncbi:MAG: ABC transporter-related protein [Parcubacteria group bacterium GW2011_GWA2_36_10]|nr:MAG: ABC transporter-related protein [Parcubacteria group bacterium GW2011_GWA2_36_10]